MATMAESSSSSSDDESNLSSSSLSLTFTLQSNGGHILEKSLKTIEEDSTPWIEYAAQQAQILHKTAEQTFDSFVSYSASRLSQIRSTSSAHFNQTLESLHDITSQYAVYENIVVAKMKEGVLVAASNPLVTCGVVSGLGFVLLKPERATSTGLCELTVSPSGLAFCDKVVGTGPRAVKGQLIKAHYVGKLENGKVFDSSYNRGSPLSFRVGVGEVIQGWDQGILGSDGVPPMLAGGKRSLKLPPELAYGVRGTGCRGGSCIIPPNAVLLFDVEFVGY